MNGWAAHVDAILKRVHESTGRWAEIAFDVNIPAYRVSLPAGTFLITCQDVAREDATQLLEDIRTEFYSDQRARIITERQRQVAATISEKERVAA